MPESITYAVVGAGIHGLSAAWHLAKELEARGTGSGRDIAVLDKAGPGAGATGIACGCLRNFYMIEPLHAILRHSVDVWMHDTIGFGFQQVGYVSCGEAKQIEDYARIHESQNAVGYPSDLYQGKGAQKSPKRIWPDLKTERVGVVIHEKISGYAGTRQSVEGFAEKCRQHDVRVLSGTEVTGYDLINGQFSKLHTNRGDLACAAVVLGLGAWTPRHWAMLDLPLRIEVGTPDGEVATDRDMWTFWRLLEGDVLLDTYHRDARGLDPPVLHVELMYTPVIDQGSGKELDDHLYVYWKNAAERLPDQVGFQGGTIPIRIGPKATVDPCATPIGTPGPSRPSPITSPRPWPSRWGASRAAASGSTPGPTGHRRLYPGQGADLRLDPPQRLHDRGQQPRLQDGRGRQAGG